MRDILDMGEAARKRHRSHMYRPHLRGEHRFDLIARFDPLDDCEHEVRPFFLKGFFLVGVHELQDEPFEEIPACRADRIHQR